MKRGRKLVAVTLTLLMTLSLAPAAFGANLEEIGFNDIPGIKVGHYTDLTNATGCTVIVVESPDGAVGAVDVRGGSPGTRETDLLDPTKTVQNVNAILLSGGSAFGLGAADGVMQYLEEQGMGVDVGATVVPIVPTAILFDLGFGNAFVRPDKGAGYRAAANAFNGVPWSDGNVGAGTGATVGKGAGAIGGASMQGGIGSFAYKFGDLYVGAIVAVNAAGNIVNPDTGEIVAGAHTEDLQFIDLEEYTVTGRYDAPKAVENTTIGCIVTNASLTQAETKKLAELAQDGYARAIRPVHTASDGDTIFAVALGTVSSGTETWNMPAVNMNLLGVMAVNAMEAAIVSAGMNAESYGGIDGMGSMNYDEFTQPESYVLR